METLYFRKLSKMLWTFFIVLCLLPLDAGSVMADDGQYRMSSDTDNAIKQSSNIPALSVGTASFRGNRIKIFLRLFSPKQALIETTIHGIVFYSTTPLANVQVDLRTSTLAIISSTITDADGAYTFSAVSPGDYILAMHGPTSEYSAFYGYGFTLTGDVEDLEKNLFLPKKITLNSPPDQSKVYTNSPTFCWQGLPEATQYSFQLNKTSDWTLVDFVQNIQTNCYTTSKILENWVEYTWGINAYDQYNHTIGDATRFTFSISATNIYQSLAPQDGHIFELSENSDAGWRSNPNSARIYVGDDNRNRQYLSILSFDTSSLPDDAVILSATLNVKRARTIGTNPFDTHGALGVEIGSPCFGGSCSLENSDFQASAQDIAGILSSLAVDNWHSTTLGANVYPYIDLTGTTQFRLRFELDDNDDKGMDAIQFFSGNALEGDRPQLIIEYTVP